jgi:hypothetical protein
MPVAQLSLKSSTMVALTGIPVRVQFRLVASGTRGNTLIVEAVDDEGWSRPEDFIRPRQEGDMLLGTAQVKSDRDLLQVEEVESRLSSA